MADQGIICPHCKKEIPLSKAISHPIREQLRNEFAAEFQKKEQQFAQKEKALIEKNKALEEDFEKKTKRNPENHPKEMALDDSRGNITFWREII